MAQDDPPAKDDPRKRLHLTEAERREAFTQLVLCRAKLTPAEATLLREVFPEILDAHQSQVWSQLQRRGLDPVVAEDLLQEVFLSLHGHILEQGFPDNIQGLLHSLTEGKLLNYVRGRRRNILSVGLPSSGFEPPKTGPEVERVLDLKELAQRILPGLSEEQREVVELVIINNVTHADAAALLGISPGALKRRLIAAKQKLLEVAELILPPARGPPHEEGGAPRGFSVR